MAAGTRTQPLLPHDRILMGQASHAGRLSLVRHRRWKARWSEVRAARSAGCTWGGEAPATRAGMSGGGCRRSRSAHCHCPGPQRPAAIVHAEPAAPIWIRMRYELCRISSRERSVPPVKIHPVARLGRLGSSTRSHPGLACTTGTQVGPPSSVAGSTATGCFPGAAYRTWGWRGCTTRPPVRAKGAWSAGAAGMRVNVVARGSLASSAAETRTGDSRLRLGCFVSRLVAASAEPSRQHRAPAPASATRPASVHRRRPDQDCRAAPARPPSSAGPRLMPGNRPMRRNQSRGNRPS